MYRKHVKSPVLYLLLCIFLFPLFANSGTDFVNKFVTRDGDKLYIGEQEFRFMGLAAPTLHQNEDQIFPDYRNRFPDEYEMRDVLESFRQIGAQATRTFSLSIKKEGEDIPVYINGLGDYNEEAFRTLDKLFQLCHEYNVRLIIPIIDSHTFHGWWGVDEFAAFRKKDRNIFWTDAQLKQDFKNLLSDLLNRTNVYTGVKYKNEPAVLAWQLGNELDSWAPDRGMKNTEWLPKITEWTLEMAAHIKAEGAQQLVMEGGGLEDPFLEAPEIDIMSKHYYEHWSLTLDRPHPRNLRKRVAGHRDHFRGKKAFVVDEFGMGEVENLEGVMEEVITTGISGGLLWGIRGHRRDGGFYYHNEAGTRFNSYHWPGFKEGDSYDEIPMLNMLQKKAHEIRGIPITAPTAPSMPPVLMETSKTKGLIWRGVTGASGYNVERSLSKNGPWKVISENISDVAISGDQLIPYNNSKRAEPLPLFKDNSAKSGQSYYYRVKAINAAGTSPYSNVMKIKAGI